MAGALLHRSVERFKADAFYRHAVLYTGASLTASVINYAYYPLMGRLIGVSGYGELQIVTSFLLQITTVFVGLNLINVNIVANHDERESSALMVALQKAIFWIILVICVGVAVASPALERFFHFHSAWPFLLVIPSLLIDATTIFWTSYLQGHRDFFSLSSFTVMTAGSKIVFSGLLVWLGLGVSGGTLGIAFGLAAGLLTVRLTARRKLPALKQTLTWPRRHELTLIRHHLSFIVEVIVALTGMSVLLSIDSLLVKHLFSADFAGRYAGVATVSRILFFASSPIVSVMLPAISLRDVAGGRAAFKRTILLSGVLCATGLAVFAAFPHLLLRLFLGGAFAQSASWLPLLALVTILVTITNVIINYALALRSHVAVVVSVVSLATAAAFISWRHGSVPQIVASACSGLIAGQLVFWLTLLTRRGRLGQSEPANPKSVTIASDYEKRTPSFEPGHPRF